MNVSYAVPGQPNQSEGAAGHGPSAAAFPRGSNENVATISGQLRKYGNCLWVGLSCKMLLLEMNLPDFVFVKGTTTTEDVPDGAGHEADGLGNATAAAGVAAANATAAPATAAGPAAAEPAADRPTATSRAATDRCAATGHSAADRFAATSRPAAGRHPTAATGPAATDRHPAAGRHSTAACNAAAKRYPAPGRHASAANATAPTDDTAAHRAAEDRKIRYSESPVWGCE